jgi:hypothetical protein
VKSTIDDADLIHCSSPRAPDRSRVRGSLPGRCRISAPAAECLARGN